MTDGASRNADRDYIAERLAMVDAARDGVLVGMRRTF